MVFKACVCVCVLIFTQLSFSYTVETLPNPTIGLKKSYLANPDHILTVDQEAILSEKLETIKQSTSHQIAVVAVTSIGEEIPKNFAVNLFQKWGIGEKGKDNGLLILLVMDQRRIEFEVGYGLEGILPDITCHNIIQSHMIPQMKEGRVFDALTSALTQVELHLNNEAPTEAAESENSAPNNFWEQILFGYIEVVIFCVGYLYCSIMALKNMIKEKKTAHIFFTFAGIFGVTALFFAPFYVDLYAIINLGHFGLVATRRREKAINYVFSKEPLSPFAFWEKAFFVLSFLGFSMIKVYCLAKQKKDQALMKEKNFAFVPDATEDSYLSASQLKEEELGSVEHEVYVNHLTHETEIKSNLLPFSKYRPCQCCKTIAAEIKSSRTITAPTYISSGTGMHQWECLFCHETYEQSFTIPKLQRSSSSSGGSSRSGGGGSSFGGGRSGGGGAGGSW
jgi:uncharacterized protein